jgi:hypothetical protein
MWSRVAGWDSIIPGPLAAVFVEDFGFDAERLAQALEAEAEDEQLYMRVRRLCSIHCRVAHPNPCHTPAAAPLEVRLVFPPLSVDANMGGRWIEESQNDITIVRA